MLRQASWFHPLVPAVGWVGHSLISPCRHQALQYSWRWAFANILIWFIINITVIQDIKASGTN
jgi:hypothetical protein